MHKDDKKKETHNNKIPSVEVGSVAYILLDHVVYCSGEFGSHYTFIYCVKKLN